MNISVLKERIIVDNLDFYNPVITITAAASATIYAAGKNIEINYNQKKKDKRFSVLLDTWITEKNNWTFLHNNMTRKKQILCSIDDVIF